MTAWMLLTLLACGDDNGTDDTGADDTGAVDDLEIAGAWSDEWETTYDLTATAFTIGFAGSEPSVFHLVSFDNDADFAVAENDADNEYSPGAFSRFDWAVEGGSTYLCQTVFDADTADAAASATAADADDLGSGCNGFAWTELLPAE